MAIVLHEIRKLFSLKMIALVALLNVIFYLMYIQFYFEHFPNGRPDKDIYKIVIEIKQQYGLELDEAEFVQFKQTFDQKVQEAELIMSRDSHFKGAGISTYEAFRTMDTFSGNKRFKELNHYAMFDPGIDLFWELQAQQYLIERFEDRLERAYANFANTDVSVVKRVDALVESGTLNTIFPDTIYRHYQSIMFYVYSISIVSILLIVSPIFLRDRRSGVIHLQHASRIGRRLFRSKLIAALLSAMLIISIQLGCFFLLYTRRGIALFYEAPINSAFNSMYFWYDLTFAQFIGLSVGILYVLGLITALAAAFFSSISANYMALVALQIPYIYLITQPLSGVLIENLIVLYRPKYAQPIAYGLLFAIVAALLAFRWRRERKGDLLL
ncbi:hypothetical protein SAMN04487969_102353 [Paenibacillus algorifonticola]|uniref:ABC-2 family transporter protein n=1 Tax=Paenibacillus algorifonticola TaxID=684063 RepID=A0A1I2A8R0_9BACL|nr:ABC transporter permease [Paenibacillus algorifonticola]SFE40216.1 hypothetical protein SAMN04487969_102353 [Paenibacillus algorifonticola]